VKKITLHKDGEKSQDIVTSTLTFQIPSNRRPSWQVEQLYRSQGKPTT